MPHDYISTLLHMKCMDFNIWLYVNWNVVLTSWEVNTTLYQTM